MCFAHVAAAVYIAHGGPEWRQAKHSHDFLYPGGELRQLTYIHFRAVV
jgi:hypothetical protein